MGRRRHANSRLTALIEDRVKLHWRGGIEHGRAEIIRWLDNICTLPVSGLRCIEQDRLHTAIEAGVFLDFMKKRVTLAETGGRDWWLGQQAALDRWLNKRWAKIGKIVEVRPRAVRGKFSVEIKLVVGRRSRLYNWGICEGADAGKQLLEAVNKFALVATSARRRGLRPDALKIARGSTTRSLRYMRKIADRHGALPIKHSVQKSPLVVCAKLRSVIGVRRPKRLLFPNAGRGGRAAWLGESLLFAAVGVSASLGSERGGEDHGLRGELPAVRRDGCSLSGWWLVPSRFAAGWPVPGTSFRLLAGVDAAACGFVADFTIRGGDNFTLLHAAGVASRIFDDAFIALADDGEREPAAIVIRGGRVLPVSAEALLSLPKLGSGAELFRNALAVATRYKPTRGHKAFVEELDRVSPIGAAKRM